MFKLFVCLVFLGVVFGDLDEEHGLRDYFRSLDPKGVKRCSGSRKKLNIEQENGPESLTVDAPNPTHTKPSPLNLELEYPGVNPAEIKDCLDKKLGSKINKNILHPEQNVKVPESQVLRRFDVLDPGTGAVTEKSNDEIKTPITIASKNNIQSDSLQSKSEVPITRDGEPVVMYPITPREIDLCSDDDDPYGPYRDRPMYIRRSMDLSVLPLNGIESEKVSDVGNFDDKTAIRSNEELEDPTNRIGVSTYNKGNVMVSRSNRICYACSTLNNPTCSHPSKLTTVKYCSRDRNSCVSKTYEGQDGTILIRDCANACNESTLPVGLVPKYKTCSICHSDLCNGAFSVNTENILFILFISCATLYKTLL